MKVAIRYLVLGLEVWLGVSGLLVGIYSLMPLVGIGASPSAPGFEQVAGAVLVAAGAALVADAVRRELRVQVVKKMERLGNPLDSPTQA
ncbi:MAG TPA: hypothetical protein VF059_11580 [Casimicrobiaceae bacterium]